MTDFETFVAALHMLQGNDRFAPMGDECPVIPPIEDYGYDLTPKCAVVFGVMGVDGVHYAILKRGGVVCDNSPVIHVSPMDSDSPHTLLAHTFLEYLATACDVTPDEMRIVLDCERAVGNSLVPFMHNRFDHSRFDLDGFGSQIALYSNLLTTREPEGSG